MDADVSITADLAKALRELDDPAARELARSGLADEQYTHRLAGATTLGIIGDASSRLDLFVALKDPIAAVRAAALEALTRLCPDQECVEHGAELLPDTSPQVRAAAVRLVATGSRRPAKLLLGGAADSSAEVRCELARHLPKLEENEAAQLLADPDEGVRRQAALCAGRQHTRVLAAMLVSDSRPDVRRAAARTLGAIGGQEAGEALIAGIEDADGVVCASVFHALERALGRKGAMGRLETELHSARAGRRRASLYALERFNGGDRTVTVWRLADDPDLDVRLAVVETASAFLSDPAPLLMYMRTDPNVEVRGSAERRLAGHAA